MVENAFAIKYYDFLGIEKRPKIRLVLSVGKKQNIAEASITINPNFRVRVLSVPQRSSWLF